MLIDRRNRLEGELEKLVILKHEAENLYSTVQSALTGIEEGLGQLQGLYDPERLRKVRSLRTTARGQYGLLTRMIISALKAGGRPMTTGEVARWVGVYWPEDAERPAGDAKLASNVRKRLRNLRVAGVLISPVLGNNVIKTTWMINPELLASERDIGSTL